MNLITKIKGLSAIGWGNAFRALAYAVKRDRLDRKYAPRPQTGQTDRPGCLISAETDSSGGTFQFENARLEIRCLTDDMARITWHRGSLPEPYALTGGDFPGVKAEISSGADMWSLHSPGLRVEVDHAGGLKFLGERGNLVRSDAPPSWSGRSTTLVSPLNEGEGIFGMGERTWPLNLRGHKCRNYNAEPMGAYTRGDDPLYVGVPVFMGLHDDGSYLVFVENSFESTFDFSSDATITLQDGALRYYVTVGPPETLLANYSRLTGRAPLPPRWALGYHQCRWSYKDDKEVRELVAGFEARDLPLSVVHLDIHYMDGYRVFTVDKERFPDLPALTAELAEKGIETVAIIDPGIKTDSAYDVYRTGLEKDVFCKLPDGTEARGPVWPGTCAFPDFTKPAARKWWAEHYDRLTRWGISGIWHDMNEVAVFASWGEKTLPACVKHDFEGRSGTHAEAHNLYGLLEARAGFEGLRAAAPDKRPWILSRSGWAGLQRYAWTWTGDCESDWWTLGQSIRIALAMGLSGIPYNGPDIGGFGGNPSPELFTRWFQAGAFLSFFRTHCAVFAPRREPWVFGEPTLSICRDFLRLRYRLLPYWYSLADLHSKTGAPLLRPMFWEDPLNVDLRNVDDQFMVGEQMLVAPVMSPGQTSREVLLPSGQWFDFWTDELFAGDSIVSVNTPLEQMPVFIRAGAVIPMEENGRIVLHLYSARPDVEGKPGPSGRLYSDAGDGYGASRIDNFLLSEIDGGLRLLRKGEGEYPCPDLSVCVHHLKVSKAQVDGSFVALEEELIPVGQFSEVVMMIE
jgi:alpha-glucosidase